MCTLPRRRCRDTCSRPRCKHWRDIGCEYAFVGIIRYDARMDETPAMDTPASDKPRRLHVFVRLAALGAVVAIGFAASWATRDAGREDAQTQRAQFEALTREVAQ